ncbi:MAG: DrmB family protein [Candidatus Sericytochromatia bacterium]
MSVVGEIRPSQLLFTYGMGSLLNLPNYSAVILGVDSWEERLATPVQEERLLQVVRQRLGEQVRFLSVPPADPEQTTGGYGRSKSNIGLPLALFPQYMVCQACRRLAPVDGTLFKFKEHRFYAHEDKYIHDNCHKTNDPALIPSRFFVVCENGHMDDFPWQYFVHRGNSDCQGDLQLLGQGSDISMITVKCKTCKTQRNMVDAFNLQKQVMPRCQGIHIHLSDQSKPCDKQMKPMTLGASNAWFPLTLSVVSIPSETDSELDQLIEQHWTSMLEHIDSLEKITFLNKINQLKPFYTYSETQLFSAIQKYRERQGSAENQDPQDLQQHLLTPEYRVLSQPGKVKNSEDFQVVEEPVPSAFAGLIEKVVLVERLREVRALIGFTRVMAPDHGDPDSQPVTVGPIAKSAPKLVPASEVRGEGLFLVFNQRALTAWIERLQSEESHWQAAHTQWRKLRKYPEPEAHFPGLQYVLLHSFSHALMRQLSLECGYSAASICEKIYSLPAEGENPAQAGILLYTASPDSEGTLGGLVELGRKERLGALIEQALENGRLCSSDPLCAEHPLKTGNQVSLHAAACHACLFAPETSCERGNHYLDRTLLVPTLSREEWAFFDV